MQPATFLTQKEIQRIARHLAAITATIAGLDGAALTAAPKKRRRRRRAKADVTVTDRLRHAIQTPAAPAVAPKPNGRRRRRTVETPAASPPSA